MKLAFAFLFAALLAQFAHAEKGTPIAAGEVVESALAVSPKISQAHAASGRARASVFGAQAGGKPKVSLGAKTSSGSIRNPSSSIDLSASYPIYDWGKTSAEVSAAEADLAQKESLFQQTRERVALDVVSLYIEVVRLQKLQSRSDHLLAGLSEIRRIAQARVEVGMANAVDLSAVDSRIALATAQKAANSSQLASAISRLESTSGFRLLAHRTFLPVRPEIFERKVIGASLYANESGEAVQSPIYSVEVQQDHGITAAMQAVSAAESRLSAAEAKAKPTLNMELSARRAMSGVFATGKKTDYSIGLSISTPLYDGGSRSSEVDQAAAALSEAEYALDAAITEYESRLESVLIEIGGLTAQVAPQEQRLEAALKTREIYGIQYLQSGNRSILDLLNAEQEVFQAAAEMIVSESSLLSAYAKKYEMVFDMTELFRSAR